MTSWRCFLESASDKIAEKKTKDSHLNVLMSLVINRSILTKFQTFFCSPPQIPSQKPKGGIHRIVLGEIIRPICDKGMPQFLKLKCSGNLLTDQVGVAINFGCKVAIVDAAQDLTEEFCDNPDMTLAMTTKKLPWIWSNKQPSWSF